MESIRALKKSDLFEARALWQARFDDPESFCDWYFQNKFTPDCSAGLFVDGALVSMIHGFPLRVLIRRRSVDALVISGVSTKAGFERRGYMHRVMRFVLQLARKRGCLLAFHRPESFDTYRSLGQLPCTRVKLAEGRGLRAPEFDETSTAGELLACYGAAGARYSGFTDRNLSDMERCLSDYCSCGGRILSERRDGRVAGYAVLLSDNTAPEVLAQSEEVYDALLARLPAGAKAKLPPDIAADGEVLDGNAMAAVDVQGLLRLFVRDPKITFSVTDPAVIQNNGVFNGLGEEVPGEGDFTLSAGELMQAVAGYRALPGLLCQETCYCVEEY